MRCRVRHIVIVKVHFTKSYDYLFVFKITKDINKFHKTIGSHQYINANRCPNYGPKRLNSLQICIDVSSQKEQVSLLRL